MHTVICLKSTLTQIIPEAERYRIRYTKRLTCTLYRRADNCLARPTSRCILFDVENISFDASLVIYINSTNIPPIMIINRIYEHQNLLLL